MKSHFPIHKQLAVHTTNHIVWHILGIVDKKVVVRAQIDTGAIPDHLTLDQACVEVGAMLTFVNIAQVYQTSEVPDDIVWVGHVHPSLCLN
jgi:hypothetical protein